MMFNGSIEHASYITKHEDVLSMTNRTVLLQVAPLLRDKSGGRYHRHESQGFCCLTSATFLSAYFSPAILAAHQHMRDWQQF